MTILINLCSIESFGVPYMSGIAPFSLKDMKDILLRLPHKYMKSGTDEIINKNKV